MSRKNDSNKLYFQCLSSIYFHIEREDIEHIDIVYRKKISHSETKLDMNGNSSIYQLS